MNHLGRAAILLVLGVMTIRLIATGGFGWFLAQHMRIPLLLAGIAMLILGACEYFASTRKKAGQETTLKTVHESERGAEPLTMSIGGETVSTPIGKAPVDASCCASPDPDHLHDDKHVSAGPKVGWLLIAPLAVLIAVAPTGLGAAAADRVDAIIPTDSGASFEALPVSDSPVEIGVLEFLNRAVWDDQRSLADVRVKMTGLVVNDDEFPDGFKLTKFLVGCCAADGLPVQVVVRGITQPLTNDTWVEVAGVWIEPDVDAAESGATPELMSESIAILPSPPTNPYESW